MNAQTIGLYTRANRVGTLSIFHCRRYSKGIDLGLSLVLSVLRAALPSPSTLSAIVLKACIAGFALCVVALHTVLARPFPQVDAWKAPVSARCISLPRVNRVPLVTPHLAFVKVRALILFDSMLCVVINACVSALDLGPDAALSSAVSATSYLLTACAAVTSVALLVGFSRSMIRGATRDANASRAAEAAAIAQALEVLSPRLEASQRNPLRCNRGAGSGTSPAAKLLLPVEGGRFAGGPLNAFYVSSDVLILADTDAQSTAGVAQVGSAFALASAMSAPAAAVMATEREDVRQAMGYAFTGRQQLGGGVVVRRMSSNPTRAKPGESFAFEQK